MATSSIKVIWIAAILRPVAIAIALCLTCRTLMAVEVSAEKASVATRNWLARCKSPMGESLSNVSQSLDVRTFNDAARGRPLFHVVCLDGGGYVVTSGDTKITPIVAFSDSGEFEADEGNPLYAMILGDMALRLDALESNQSGGTQTKASRNLLSASASSLSVAELEWAELTGQASARRRLFGASYNSDNHISDICVAPLLKTRWGQSGVWQGEYTFNRYTPGNSVCGCVALAYAQIMRYWKYPDADHPVQPFTKTCKYNNVSTNVTAIGGTYDWANMPMSNSEVSSVYECEQLGKLAFDMGVLCEMSWTASDSGAYYYLGTVGLKDIYGYASSGYLAKGDMTGELSEMEWYADSILGDLDAGMPVCMGIHPTHQDYGHAVVADGYGYLRGTLYCHVNFGWHGSYNAWYNLFVNPQETAYYSVLGFCSRNVHPSEKGSVFSGRVRAEDGMPVCGATVVLIKPDGSTEQTQASENGIYHFRIGQPGTYGVSASFGPEMASAEREVAIATANLNTRGNDLALEWGEKELRALSISGEDVVEGGSTTRYSAIGSLSDGTTAVLPASWEIVSGDDHAQIHARSALMVARRDVEEGIVVVRATGTFNGSAYSATKTVTIPALPSCTISFVANGGEMEDDVERKIVCGSSLGALPSISKKGHVFSGWWTSEDESGLEVSMNTAFDADTTLYAHWTEIVYSWEYTLDENGNATLQSSSSDSPAFTIVSPAGASIESHFTIPAEVEGHTVVAIGRCAFCGIGDLVSVEIPDTVTKIGNYAFDGCRSLKSVRLSANLVGIGMYAFGYCYNLQEVEIPAATSYIDCDAFSGCGGLKEISVDEGNAVYSSQDGILYNKDKTTLIICGGSKSGVVEIPDSVTNIGTSAFCDCYYITELHLPPNLERIESYAFAYTSFFSDIILGESLASIGVGAFWYCENLRSVTILSRDVVLGPSLFYGCSGLAELHLSKDLMASIISTPEILDGCPEDMQVIYDDLVDAEQYTVTFDANGGTVEETTRLVKYLLGTPPTPYNEGFFSLGWYTERDGGERVDALSQITSNITLYAHWIALPFSFGGDAIWTSEGDDTWCSGKISHSQNCWIEKTISAPCRVSFKWKTSSEARYDLLKFYIDGESVASISGIMDDWAEYSHDFTGVGDVALRWEYSKDNSVSSGDDCGWVKDFSVFPYLVISLDANGGECEKETILIPEGEPIDILPTPLRDGHEFIGWFTEPDGGTQVLSGVRIDGDTILYAQWKELLLFANTGLNCEGWNGNAINESNLDFMVPATAELPWGAKVRIKTIKLASLNASFTLWDANTSKSDPYYVRLNGVNSDPVVFGGAIASSATTSDNMMLYAFSEPCDVIVGKKYPAVTGNNAGGVGNGIAFLHSNGKLLYGSGADRASVRYVKTGNHNSLMSTTTAAAITGEDGWFPVYEIEADIVSKESSGLGFIAFDYSSTLVNHSIRSISDGWFKESTRFTGETPQNTNLRLGPDSDHEFALQITSATCPYYNVAAMTNAFSFALYADVSAMPAGGKAVMVSFGNNQGNTAMLYREGDFVRLGFFNSAGTIIGEVASARVTSGYHLYTAVCDPVSGAVALGIDGAEIAQGAAGKSVALGNGFQIGSVFYGCPSGFTRGTNMAIVKMLGYNAELTAKDTTTLAKEYPAVCDVKREIKNVDRPTVAVTVTEGQTATLDPSSVSLQRINVLDGGCVIVKVTTAQEKNGYVTSGINVGDGGSLRFMAADGSIVDASRVTESGGNYALASYAIPALSEGATGEEIATILGEAVDREGLVANLDTPAEYNGYRAWVGRKSSPEAAMTSLFAWAAFALDAPNLMLRETPIDSDDIVIGKFDPIEDAGEFALEVSIDGVDVGDEAETARLVKVFGLEGAADLDESHFDSDNVTLTAGEPKDGKVRLTVEPKAEARGDGKSFFMRVKFNW